ncbi:hypothetical protein Poli38472_009139 [Pythium oligandrum]|uniref:PLC-like phosphodiesterase n=1 Tax=Pythium oligandrum TaxID=41045 RepID=A0A8K1CK70_PYTOL|nr:hypothetical protein Poli38472_009139 [Pythium oligandrum]|eukprot:TMW64972.1 hypothetical protein Poli38472_009139 [Pythium oligandrum]
MSRKIKWKNAKMRRIVTKTTALAVLLAASTTIHLPSVYADDAPDQGLSNEPLTGDMFAIKPELWTSDARKSFHQWIRDTVPDTVPKDVQCKKVEKCDKHRVCVITCEPGSVVVDPWLQQALKFERKLAYRRNFCHAHLPGTHNSAITIADGYGVEDHVFEGYLKYLSWFKKGMEVHTNDQLFSLTDQLNMGVRFIELDVHWFNNDLHIAHCGGFHSALLDSLISAFNKIANWLGTDIQWDSQTIGCKPSLSSIPASEQRRLDDALKEISTWLHKPENKDEFLMIFFDDENNLFRWKKVTTMIKYLKSHFGPEEILLPADLVHTYGWPSFETLLASGKRVIFMSGSNYSPRGDDVLFVKDEICNWTEPQLPFEPYPSCNFPMEHMTPLDHRHWIFRPETSEIVYGFLNADGHLGDNTYILNETSIPPMVECGVNIPSPDNITPKRVESTIWTLTRPDVLEPGKCVALIRSKLTWVSLDCEHPGIVAGCVQHGHHTRWALGPQPVKEKDAAASCSSMSKFWVYDAPGNGLENKFLHALLMQAPTSVQGVWLDAAALASEAFDNRVANMSPLSRVEQISDELALNKAD